MTRINLQRNKTNKQTRKMDWYDKDGKHFGAYTIISSEDLQNFHKIKNRRRRIMANKIHVSEKSRCSAEHGENSQTKLRKFPQLTLQVSNPCFAFSLIHRR